MQSKKVIDFLGFTFSHELLLYTFGNNSFFILKKDDINNLRIFQTYIHESTRETAFVHLWLDWD